MLRASAYTRFITQIQYELDQVTNPQGHYSKYNYVLMSIWVEFKLEYLKIMRKSNHFVLRTQLFIKSTRWLL